ncbi:hypothetical protein GCM10025331_07570 [Actinoplanes utahensis]|nr:hypothetical protein Aut01nite_14830 [Actinoplanes utahensis]
MQQAHGGGRRSAPEQVEELLPADGNVGRQGQPGQEQPAAHGPEAYASGSAGDLERAEQSDPQRAGSRTGNRAGSRVRWTPHKRLTRCKQFTNVNVKRF